MATGGRAAWWATAAGLAGTVALAFGVRLAYLVLHGGTGDYFAWCGLHFNCAAHLYEEWAADLCAGLGYAKLGHPPGYPCFLALLRALGLDDLGQRVVQGLIDSGGVLAVALLLRRAGQGAGWGLLGGLVYAVYPVWSAGCVQIEAAGLTPSLILWCLVALVEAGHAGRRWPWFAAGGAVGLACLIRSDLLLLVGPALAWAVIQTNGRRRWWACGLVALGYALPNGAWMAHNAWRHGHFVHGTGGGYALWEGLGEFPNDHGYVLSDGYVRDMLAEKGIDTLSVEADAYLKRDYLRAWREDPGFVLSAMARRWQQIAFEAYPWNPAAFRGLQKRFDRFGLLALAAAVALYRRNRPALLVTMLPLAYACLSIGVTHYEPRYVFYVPLSYLFASVLLLAAAWQGLARWSRRAAVALAVIAGVTAGGYAVRELAYLQAHAQWALITAQAREGAR
jgi:hypothetical protein